MRAVKNVCILFGSAVTKQCRTNVVTIVRNKHQCAVRFKPISRCAGLLNGNISFSTVDQTSRASSVVFHSQVSHFHTSHASQGMDISSIELAGHGTRYTPDWTLHECKLKCNPNERRPDGMEFVVRYIDTAASLDPAVRDKMPVVVATHGSPGSYKDLVLVIEPLIDKGARLVLPNMPGQYRL